MRGLTDINLYFIAMATPEEATAFGKEQGAPQPFICDKTQWLYQNFNLKAGGTSQLLNHRTLLRGIRAAAAGHLPRKPTASPRQLAGTFIVGKDGETKWEHRAKDASDNATPAQILKALERLSER